MIKVINFKRGKSLSFTYYTAPSAKKKKIVEFWVREIHWERHFLISTFAHVKSSVSVLAWEGTSLQFSSIRRLTFLLFCDSTFVSRHDLIKIEMFSEHSDLDRNERCKAFSLARRKKVVNEIDEQKLKFTREELLVSTFYRVSFWITYNCLNNLLNSVKVFLIP